MPLLAIASGWMGLVHAQAPEAPPLARLSVPAHRGVVDDTWVVAPRRLGGASLMAVKNYADEGDIAAGVSLRYRFEKAEWVVADVFIYPAGQGDEGKMLARAATDFRESVAFAERQQIYRNVWWGDEAPYTATLSAGRVAQGRFLPIVFDAQQEMLASRAYLFYRKLYYIKIRLTTTVEAVDSMSENADRFIAALLDGVQVVSSGSCARQMDVAVLAPGQSPPPDLAGGVSSDGYRLALPAGKPGTPAYAARMAKAMATAAKRQVASGCTVLPYDPPPDDAARAVLHLRFEPDDWGAAPAQR